MNELIPMLVPPDPGELIMRPGTVVGKGLAVALMQPLEDDVFDVWSLTAVPSGRSIPGAIFGCERLARRCAREIIRKVSFDYEPQEQVWDSIKAIWPFDVLPILDQYLELDNLWCERQENADDYGVHPA